jgi:hypothetical protein
MKADLPVFVLKSVGSDLRNSIQSIRDALDARHRVLFASILSRWPLRRFLCACVCSAHTLVLQQQQRLGAVICAVQISVRSPFCMKIWGENMFK